MCHIDICFKQKKIFFSPFLTFFSTLPGTQTIKVIDLIFFNELAMINWAMNMHFKPLPLNKDSEPPAFTRLSCTFYA